MVVLLFFYTIMAGVYTFGKQATLYTAPFFLTGIRITGGGLCILAYQYFSDSKKFYLKKSFIPYLIAYMFGVFCMDNFRLQALRFIPSSNAALIATTAPFIAAFFSWWWFKEKFGTKKIAALLLGVVGMLPLLLTHITAPEGNLAHILPAYLGVIVSTIGFVLCGILSKELIQNQKAPFFMIVGTAMTGGGLIGLILSALFETWNPIPITDVAAAAPVLGYLFITHSLMAYPLYNFLVQKYPVTLVAFAQLTVPFFTAGLGRVIFGEVIGIPFFISLVILSFSFWLFYKEELRAGLIRQ
jgi:drug/metabolite transporter (DMT)-like permease